MQNQTAEQVTKALTDANNVLVTVKNSPSVDELSAAIALTLILNHLNKHAVTVFSGRVPSTIEFLQPDMAIDTNTDSLRDFIIALDKSKADKLRYKVEDNVVRIFITPYKTSISEKDLEFSQGDFNVDVVVALGVVNREDFDQAVTAHGRILHDATVITITKHAAASELGALNWYDQQASSVSEMLTSIVDGLGENVLDGQTATALLTGIVAETDRFKNANTTPQVLSLSSKLMAAGANQQLIAEKLEEPETVDSVQPLLDEVKKREDGALEISHENEEDVHKIHIDDSGNLQVPTTEVVDMPEDNSPVEDDSNHAYLKPDTAPKLFAQDDSGTVSALPMFGDGTHLNSLTTMSDSGAMQKEKKVIEPLTAEDAIPANEEPALPLPDAAPAPTDEHLLPETTITPIGVTSTPQPVVQAMTNSVTEPSSEVPPAPIVEPPSPEQVASEHKDQTLSDLEAAVAAATQKFGQPVATPVIEQSNVDEFLGTTRATEPAAPEVQPPPEQPQSIEAPAQALAAPLAPPTIAIPTPQVTDPTAPPTVPPPLMPPAPAQPQFFDADGNSSNPFLNPNQ